MITCSGSNERIIPGGTAKSPDDVRRLHDMGLRFAEVAVPDPDRFPLDEYRVASRETGLFYLCHGPVEGDPVDVHNLETVYLPKLFKVLSIMPELEMRLLTVHLWMDPRFVSKETISFKVGLLRRLTAAAAGSGITVCLENLSENFQHFAPVFSAVPELRMTLDLGHAQLLADENTSFGFLEAFPERIGHIHLHDNLGGDSPADDLHLPVGEGKIDFPRIFKKLGAARYAGTMTLELPPGLIAGCLGYVGRLIDSMD